MSKPFQNPTKTHTNIKGLPLGPTDKYFTERGYSQSYPWKYVSHTAKTITLCKVNVAKDPDWKPEWVAGGFAGHCTNQSQQTWLYDGCGDRTVTIRKVKSPYFGETTMWAHKGTRFSEDRAIEFYDYNF